ncbi:MAG: response regulator, partial [Eubacteriales bacterium]|nr:response regulator [Eubacteriales bacterium]
MYKLLLADDEGIVLDSLKFIITKQYGELFEIRTAKTGRQVIEIAQEFAPDIAFVDIQMPGIKGIEAIREVRTFNKRCQFIIMSAYDKFTFAQEAINLGVIEYLTKPANREKIIAALEKARSVIDQDRSRRSQDLIIREKLESVIPIIENGFINMVLYQDYSPDVSHYLELLNIHAEYGWIMALEFSEPILPGEEEASNPVGTTVRLQKYILAFREIVHEFFPHAVIGSIVASHVAIFIPHDTKSMEYEERIRIIETSRNMVRRLGKQIDLKFRSGIGDVWKITELSKSYEQAKKSLTADKGSVVHLKDIKMELEYAPDYPDELERQIFHFVFSGDEDNVIRTSGQFFDWMTANYADYMQSIRTKVLEFVMWAEREVFLKGGIPYSFLYRKDYLDQLLSCSAYDELRRWFIGKMCDACRTMNHAKEEKETTTIGKARQYILKSFNR